MWFSILPPPPKYLSPYQWLYIPMTLYNDGIFRKYGPGKAAYKSIGWEFYNHKARWENMYYCKGNTRIQWGFGRLVMCEVSCCIAVKMILSFLDRIIYYILYPICKISSAHPAKRFFSVYLGHARAHDKYPISFRKVWTFYRRGGGWRRDIC